MQRCSHRPETFSLNVLYIEQLNDLYRPKVVSFYPITNGFFVFTIKVRCRCYVM